MRNISAQYIITAEGKILKKGIVTTDSDSVITKITDTGGELSESSSIEFYNGIIVPGFINCHCHLELSHMRSRIRQGTGLGGFIKAVNLSRQAEEKDIIAAAAEADREMYDEGIVACGDISNKSISFSIKAGSHIDYVTFIELFGVVPEKCNKRLDEALEVRAAAVAAGLRHYLVPHAVYSVSRALFTLLMQQSGPAPVYSMHFLESPDERSLASHHRGPMLESYSAMGITPESMDVPGNHLEAALQLAKNALRLILVHNTFITKEEAITLSQQGNVSWCLCPSSNLYITGTMPPAEMIRNAGGNIVIGTDSLSSNEHLSILNELRLLQDSNPGISLGELVKWATLNGASALGLNEKLGSISPGKRPGLLLIENMDLPNMKLLPQSRVRRLL
jgi:aminodeoxyfutalosine deaminase